MIGAGKALDLMNGAPASSGRKGIGGCASPVPLKDRDEKPCSAPGTAGARPTVRVERAEFGLAARTSAGRPVLVPSWLFQVRPAGEKETSTVAHPAIDPAHLTGPEAPGSPTPSASSSPRARPVSPATAPGARISPSSTRAGCAPTTRRAPVRTRRR